MEHWSGANVFLAHRGRCCFAVEGQLTAPCIAVCVYMRWDIYLQGFKFSLFLFLSFPVKNSSLTARICTRTFQLSFQLQQSCSALQEPLQPTCPWQHHTQKQMSQSSLSHFCHLHYLQLYACRGGENKYIKENIYKILMAAVLIFLFAFWSNGKYELHMQACTECL